MWRARSLRQWTVCAAVFALLLKAAVPMLASTAAALQGRSVAEVCAVYGVRTVALAHEHEHHAEHAGHEAPDHGSDSAATHGAQHCALSALSTLAAGDAAAFEVPPAAHGALPQWPPRFDSIPDAAAAWGARLWHAPPNAASLLRIA